MLDIAVIKQVSHLLGLGETGLQSGIDGVALTHNFVDQSAANAAVNALEGLRAGVYDVADYKQQSDGTYRVYMHEGNFDAISNFKVSDVEKQKSALGKAIALDNNKREQIKTFDTELQAALEGRNIFAERGDAEKLAKKINERVAYDNESMSVYEEKIASIVPENGQFKIVMDPRAAYYSSQARSASDYQQLAQQHTGDMIKRMEAQTGDMTKLSEAIGKTIERKGNSYIIETTPEEANAIANALNGINSKLAIVKDGNVIIQSNMLKKKSAFDEGKDLGDFSAQDLAKLNNAKRFIAQKAEEKATEEKLIAATEAAKKEAAETPNNTIPVKPAILITQKDEGAATSTTGQAPAPAAAAESPTIDAPPPPPVATPAGPTTVTPAPATPPAADASGKTGEAAADKTADKAQVPPPPEGNAVTKNQYGIMAGSGVLLLGLMMGMDPLIGMLLALLAFAAGSFLGDKEKGVLGQMSPDLFAAKEKKEESKDQSKTIQKDGATTTEVTKTADEKKSREAPAAPEAEKPKPPPLLLRDGKIDLKELQSLADTIHTPEIKSVIQSMDPIRGNDNSLTEGKQLFRNAIILTPEATDKGAGRIIYAEVNDRDNSLMNIQISNGTRVIHEVVGGDFKNSSGVGKEILDMLDKEQLATKTVLPDVSKADDIHGLLTQKLYTPTKAPEKDKGKGI